MRESNPSGTSHLEATGFIRPRPVLRYRPNLVPHLGFEPNFPLYEGGTSVTEYAACYQKGTLDPQMNTSNWQGIGQSKSSS